jgi:murein DD-endopeptidase MepM/ murein hydrolase activator NlpD
LEGEGVKQNYFILVLAHSLHGKLRRVHIPHRAIHLSLAALLLTGLAMFGFVSSYARMAWKVANYNSLKSEADAMRLRYQNLQKQMNQTTEQLASLQLFAKEVSVAYGIKQKLEGPADISAEGRLVPTISESLHDYNFLRSSAVTRPGASYARRWHSNTIPSIWPVDGRLMGPYGQRTDPFSGEGAYHTGVDISAPSGTPIRAAADGIVSFAARSGGYGRLVIVDHGGGFETYYAHLSRYDVLQGQEIRRGNVVGAVGSSGRVTAPHLHYEVRNGGAPVNPYRFLARPSTTQVARRDFAF